MKITEWDEKYSVGVNELDNQHKQLINILSDLYEAMQAYNTDGVLGEILNRLMDYTKYHFSSEETYMTQYDYLDLVSHKKEHEAFIKKVTEFKVLFDAGESSSSIGLSITSFAKEWLFNHISGTDKKYGPYLNSKGIN